MPYSDKPLNSDEVAAGAVGCSFICLVLMLLVGFTILASFVFRFPLADVEPGGLPDSSEADFQR